MQFDILELKNELEQRGVSVQARLTVGDPKHKFSAPPEEARRLMRLQKLFSHLAATQPAKMKTLITSVSSKAGNESHASYLKAILETAQELPPEQLEELQKLLYISDDELTVQNLDKYVKNVQKEIGDKGNIWEVAEREIGDELKVPRLKNKDLHISNKISEPETVLEMIEQAQLASENNLDRVCDLLFGSSWNLELSATSPVQSAGEMMMVRDATIHFLDHHSPGWEGHVSLVFIREMSKISIITIKGDETAVIRRSMKAYRSIMREAEDDL